MKRICITLILAASALLLAGCHGDLDRRIDELKEDVAALEAKVSSLNSSLNALSDLISALEKNDHIAGVTEFVSEGRKAYRVTFTSGSTLILNSGIDGVKPIVGVRYNEEYGAYYWTIQMGESGTPTWMTNSYGLRVRASGTVPRLKIEDGVWWYTFDGTSWNKCYWGPAQGEPGSSVFSSIDTSDPYYVLFCIGEYNYFRMPTQKAFDELTQQCNSINEQFKTYTDLVENLDKDIFVSDITAYEENGEKGYRFTLESGKVLTVRNGLSSRDSVLLSAKAYTDGKYYWVFRNRSDQPFEWLRYKGEMICVSYEDVTPHIGLVDSLGTIYFTVSYEGGETEMMRDKDGNAVAATGSVVLDFFTAADVSDPSRVSLTLTDGTVISIPRTREYAPEITELSLAATYVMPETSYKYHLLVFVKDTLSSKDVLSSFAAYQEAADIHFEAIAVDDGYVNDVAVVEFRTTKIDEGVEYNTIYDVRFRTGYGDDWDLTRKYRIALFLTWRSHSLMKVVEFDRRIPAEEVKLNKNKIELKAGASFTLTYSVDPGNTTDKPAWSTSDKTVATVSNKGVVTAVAPGTCTITLKVGKIEATCECKVVPAT